MTFAKSFFEQAATIASTIDHAAVDRMAEARN